MMRRLMIFFLMLLMLTPAMVCVMTLCPEPAQAGIVADVPPCHDAAPADTDAAPRVPMLAGDCLMNDLGAAADAPDVPFPALAFILVPFLLPAMLSFAPPAAGLLSARAPPGPNARASFHRILITSRILQ